jgi:tRNA(fMet)-specific endonuclease VapC
MDAVLLDTTVASLLHPKKKRALWGWAVENRWGKKNRQGLEAFLRRFLVVPYDFELAKVWAEVTAHCKKRGRRLEAGDAWIVATAVQRKLPLLTQDADHLGLGIPRLKVISSLAIQGGIL